MKSNLPDQTARDQIVAPAMLHRNLIVEAAAGTGKTTSLVGRMIALISERECSIETIAAVTFTRKAAAELRARFQIELEKQAKTSVGKKQERIRKAVAGIERCFIGTIHSFCARLLRERPVEAGVDVAFTELDEAADSRLRRKAWREHIARLYATDDPALEQLAALGVEVWQLEDAFVKLAEYSDVADEDWPCPPMPMPDLTGLKPRLEKRIEHIKTIADKFPTENNHLLQRYRRILAIARQVDWTQVAEVMELVEEYQDKLVVPDGFLVGKDGEERDWWNEYISEAKALTTQWRIARYEPLLRAILPVRKEYDQLRREQGGLNFQDLLLRAAILLKRFPDVRRYFRKRFTHLLVDEFQDTDPIQAEVMLLLTAGDSDETDWRKCRPVPGSLFVVGDPKQSIYRFRRADIVTYNTVKRITCDSGGLEVHLTTSFRSEKPILDWVNSAFASKFPSPSTRYSPEYVALDPSRSGINKDSIQKFVWPKELSRHDLIVNEESRAIARTICHQIQSGGDRGTDYLILARKNQRLGIYAQALQELGVPCEITGGATLNDTLEVALLHVVLRVLVEPHNPVALVAALRSEVFGVSDPLLYAFHRAGGCFDFRVPLPANLDPADAAVFQDAWDRFRRYANWLQHLPPVVAFERIANDLGLFARAAAEENGSVRAGSLGKALELLRARQQEAITTAGLVEILGRIAEVEDEDREREDEHDGVAAHPATRPRIRIMNIHKAKGLEADAVFLADPAGQKKQPPQIHIDREGDRTRGYLVIGPVDRYGNQTILAQPPDWDTRWKLEEDAFENAEYNRIMYVAATRAKKQISVSLRSDKFKNNNPWEPLRPDLATVPELKFIPTPAREIIAPAKLSECEVAGGSAAATNRWKVASLKTYDAKPAKLLASSRRAPAAEPSDGEHGTEWGTVIHALLQTAMIYPRANLLALAQTELADAELDLALAHDAIKLVESVMKSPIWKRATKSKQRLVEVPFERMITTAENPSFALPTILRGVMDLVFLEKDGWVIVDYKTDVPPKGGIDSLVEHYRPQLELYAREWRRLGLLVSEVGLFFTRTGDYKILM